MNSDPIYQQSDIDNMKMLLFFALNLQASPLEYIYIFLGNPLSLSNFQ